MERTMANEEKAREIANNCSTEIVGAEVSDETYITTEPDCYTAAMTMAQWKDEQLAKEKQALIDKACEWMNVFLNTHYVMRYKDNCDPDKSWIIEGFKRMMNKE